VGGAGGWLAALGVDGQSTVVRSRHQPKRARNQLNLPPPKKTRQFPETRALMGEYLSSFRGNVCTLSGQWRMRLFVATQSFAAFFGSIMASPVTYRLGRRTGMGAGGCGWVGLGGGVSVGGQAGSGEVLCACVGGCESKRWERGEREDAPTPPTYPPQNLPQSRMRQPPTPKASLASCWARSSPPRATAGPGWRGAGACCRGSPMGC
jgi:hypothetical protein